MSGVTVRPRVPASLRRSQRLRGGKGFKGRNGDAAFLGKGSLEFGKGTLKGGSDLGGLGDVPGSGQGFGGEGGVGGVPQGGIRGLEGGGDFGQACLEAVGLGFAAAGAWGDGVAVRFNEEAAAGGESSLEGTWEVRCSACELLAGKLVGFGSFPGVMDGKGQEDQGGGAVAGKDAAPFATEAGDGTAGQDPLEIMVMVNLSEEEARVGGVAAGGAALSD